MDRSRDEMIAYNKKRIQEDSRWCLMSWAGKYVEDDLYVENDEEEYDDDDADCIFD